MGWRCRLGLLLSLLDTGRELIGTLFAAEALHVDAHKHTEDIDHARVLREALFREFGVLLDRLQLLDEGGIGEVLLSTWAVRNLGEQVGVVEELAKAERLGTVSLLISSYDEGVRYY